MIENLITKLFFVFCIFTLSLTLNAQSLSNFSFPVTVNGENLKYALAGGLNKPQFLDIDLNQDGIEDLYVFDREGSAHLTFINNGTNDAVDYEYAPIYERQFPDNRSWVIIEDYDQDGAKDIFAYAYDQPAPGCIVYKGRYENGIIHFDRLQVGGFPGFNLLNVEVNGNPTNIAIAETDYPAIVDVDGDEDLDILTFEPNGGPALYYFRNRSVEMGYGLDSLIFTFDDQCWGGFKETGLNGDIILSDDPDDCASGLVGNAANRHGASGILAIDMDNDQDLEIILGDFDRETLTILYNGGTPDNAWITSFETNFPSTSLPADMPLFLTAYNLDTDNDAIRDLLVSPTSGSPVEDVECVWRYKNVGSNENPVFQLQETDFLVGEMLEMGTGSRPALVDVNADGLLDLVVGNLEFYVPSSIERDSRLHLFLNTGTATSPKFELSDTDWLNFSQYSNEFNYDFAPTFGDIDSDDDLDLFVGEKQGGLFFVENTAGPGAPLSFASPQYSYADIDVQQHSVPQIVDLNRDGLPDIVMGQRLGTIVYFQNIGTSGNPDFNPDFTMPPNNIKLGDVNTQDFDSPTKGFSAPYFIDFDGEYMLFAGSFRGGVRRYTNIDGNLDGVFTLETDRFGGLREGENTHLAFGDLNNDDILEVVVGNSRGGLRAYVTNYTLEGTVNTENIANQMEVKVFPNPASDQVILSLDQNISGNANLQLFNSLGQQVRTFTLTGNRFSFPVGDLPEGVYILRLSYEGEEVVKRFIVNN